MFYEYPITVPANTSEADAVEELLSTAHGIVQRISIQFLFGCANLVRVRLDYHRLLSIPADRTKYIAGDGTVVLIEGPLETNSEPYVWKASLWNIDDTYNHVVTIRFDMVESSESIMFSKILAGMSKFLKMVGVKV